MQLGRCIWRILIWEILIKAFFPHQPAQMLWNSDTSSHSLWVWCEEYIVELAIPCCGLSHVTLNYDCRPLPSIAIFSQVFFLSGHFQHCWVPQLQKACLRGRLQRLLIPWTQTCPVRCVCVFNEIRCLLVTVLWLQVPEYQRNIL